MELENIKVGDTVLIPVRIKYSTGFTSIFLGEYFIPKTVTKVTKTRFSVGQETYLKNGGSGYGKTEGFAALEGSVHRMGISKVLATDQSSEYNEMKLRIALFRDIKDIAERISETSARPVLKNATSKELEEAKVLLEKAISLLHKETTKEND